MCTYKTHTWHFWKNSSLITTSYTEQPCEPGKQKYSEFKSNALSLKEGRKGLSQIRVVVLPFTVNDAFYVNQIRQQMTLY